MKLHNNTRDGIVFDSKKSYLRKGCILLCAHTVIATYQPSMQRESLIESAKLRI